MSSLKEKNPAPRSRRGENKTTEKDPSVQKEMTSLLRSIMYTPGRILEVDKSKEQTQIIEQVKLFTDTQISGLLDLTLPNGTPFMDFKTELAFEFIGGCEKTRRDGGSIDDLIRETASMLQAVRSSGEDVNQYRYSYIDRALWYEKEEGVYQNEIKRLKTKIAVKKGIFPCSVCQAAGRNPFNTNTVEIQIRSGDEPPTNFNDCNTCGHKWRIG